MRQALALALLLGGCSAFGGGRAGETQQEVCAREAENSPAVQEIRRIGAGAPQYLWENEPTLRRARQDATLACLRARGLAPKGGVERPRP